MAFIYNKIEYLKELGTIVDVLPSDLASILESMEGQIERLQEKCVKMQEQMNKLGNHVIKLESKLQSNRKGW